MLLINFLRKFLLNKLANKGISLLILCLKKLSSLMFRLIRLSTKNGSTEAMYGDFSESIWKLKRKLAQERQKFKRRNKKERFFLLRCQLLELKHNLLELAVILYSGASFGLGCFSLSTENALDTTWKVAVALNVVRIFEDKINLSVRQAAKPLLERGAAKIELGTDGSIIDLDDAQQLLVFESEAVIEASNLAILSLTNSYRETFLQEPEKHKMGVYESLDTQGQQISILWLNLPIYNEFDLERIVCLAIKVNSPRWAKGLVGFCQPIIWLLS
jgi:hypothetical protein